MSPEKVRPSVFSHWNKETRGETGLEAGASLGGAPELCVIFDDASTYSHRLATWIRVAEGSWLIEHSALARN